MARRPPAIELGTLEKSGRLPVRAAVASRFGGIERLVHDLADGAGAAAALGAATETAIDLPGRARPRLRRDGGADIVVAQNIAGADDHEVNMVPNRHFDTAPTAHRQKKSTDFTGSLNWQTARLAGLYGVNHRAGRL